MALSFRQIGSRLKLQGGGSGSNVFIGNKLASAQPIIISGNDKLIESIVKNINTRTDLINTLLLPVDTLVRAQSLDILYLVSLINPAVILLLLNNTSTFVSGIFTTYTSLFYTTIKTKFETPVVLLSLANRLTPYAATILATYANLTAYIRTSFIQYLTDNEDKLKQFSERLIPYLFENNFGVFWFITRYMNILQTRYLTIGTFNFTIIPNQCFNSTYVSFCNILLPSNSSSTVTLSSTVFTNSAVNVFTSVLFDLQDTSGTILQTLFSSAGGASSITVSFTSTISNPSAVPMQIKVCTRFQMAGSGFVTANGIINLSNAPL